MARKLMRLAAAARRAEFKRDRDVFLASKSFVFDEMETFEHTKMKPLSIALAVEQGTRRILAVEVASMPAKGLLAARSRTKYGPRPDHRPLALAALCREVRRSCPVLRVVKSDGSSRSAYAFIVMVDHADSRGYRWMVGDILKPASWKAPAKNFSRGNVLNPKSYQNFSYYGL